MTIFVDLDCGLMDYDTVAWGYHCSGGRCWL